MTLVLTTTEKTWIERLLFVAVIAFVLFEWHASHKDLKTMETTIAATEKTRKTEVKEVQTKVQEIQNVTKKAKTPKQQVATINELLDVPVPITLPDNADGTGKGTEGSSANVPDGSAVVPPADVKPLLDTLTECAVCKLKLASDEKQIVQLTSERDSAVKTAKGGSFWRRTRTAAKFIAIGVGVGVVVGLAAAHK